MSGSGDDVPLRMIREAVRSYQDAVGLRAASRAAGMSPNGLKEFLKGTRPIPRTMARLRAWYLMGGWKEVNAGSAEVVEVAVEVLLQHLPPGDRGGARDELLAGLREITAAAGARVPGWLQDAGDGPTS